MQKTTYSHAFLVGSFNGKVSPPELDKDTGWKRDVVLLDPKEEERKYRGDYGYSGLCSLYYKAHLDTMIEGEGVQRPKSLNVVCHYIYDYGKGRGVNLNAAKKQGKEPFVYVFNVQKLHFYFLPLDVVFFAIEIDDSGTDIDELTAGHFKISRIDSSAFGNESLSKSLMPITKYCDSPLSSSLIKDGSKLKIFQTIKLDNIPHDGRKFNALLYELGTSSPIDCVIGDANPNLKPSNSYFETICNENMVSTFDSWKGLGLMDSFTALGHSGESFNENDFNYVYFPLIYLRCLFEKTFCFSRNNAYRQNDSQVGNKLTKEISFMEKYYFYESISYNFQPNLLYKSIAKGLEVKEERNELSRQIKEKADDEAKEKDKRFNLILACVSIFAIFSVACDICSMIIHVDSELPDSQIASICITVALILSVLFLISAIQIAYQFKPYKAINRFIKSIPRVVSKVKGRIVKKKITIANRDHILQHFNSQAIGSRFFANSPDEMVKEVESRFNHILQSTKPDGDGKFRLSITFPRIIGVSSVINIDELSDTEKESINVVERNGRKVRCVKTNRVNLTNECQIILSPDWQLITMFPGELAPPLPPSPDVHDEYWDNHVFIEPQNSK
ncbi:MAG: hypothetical protein IJ183_02280 [Prevotella sp.]|nr:hypothetical protein [Prevotella sp.]